MILNTKMIQWVVPYSCLTNKHCSVKMRKALETCGGKMRTVGKTTLSISKY